MFFFEVFSQMYQQKKNFQHSPCINGPALPVVYEDVLRNIIQRDHIDTTRADSPLTKASDAIEIDNSLLTRAEQLELILGYVDKVISE